MSIAATMANAIVNTQLKISLTGDVFSSGFFGSISSVAVSYTHLVQYLHSCEPQVFRTELKG